MESVTRIGQAALIAVAAFCALAIDTQAILQGFIIDGHYVGDFTVFWAAANVEPAVVYDVDAISRAQAPLTGGDVGPRPFVNPPSFLPWLEPFSRLSFFPALALWTLLGLAAFAWSSRSLVTWRHLPLILIAPPFVLGVVAGQVTFLVAAATITAILQLKTRPILAGVLLGLAATVKPQSVLLVPLALLAGAHWRTMISAAVTGGAIGPACVLVQGPQLWLDWWQALWGFSDIVKADYLIHRGATPTNLAYLLGLTGAGAQVLIWGLFGFGVVVVIAAFRGPRDDVNRIAGLVAGNLLCAPYAMPYEVIPLLIPGVLWLTGKDKRWWLPGFLMISQLLLPVGVIVMGAVAFWRSGGWRNIASLAPGLRLAAPRTES